jgi:hypothetical protein
MNRYGLTVLAAGLVVRAVNQQATVVQDDNNHTCLQSQ